MTCYSGRSLARLSIYLACQDTKQQTSHNLCWWVSNHQHELRHMTACNCMKDPHKHQMQLPPLPGCEFTLYHRSIRMCTSAMTQLWSFTVRHDICKPEHSQGMYRVPEHSTLLKLHACELSQASQASIEQSQIDPSFLTCAAGGLQRGPWGASERQSAHIRGETSRGASHTSARQQKHHRPTSQYQIQHLSSAL